MQSVLLDRMLPSEKNICSPSSSTESSAKVTNSVTNFPACEQPPKTHNELDGRVTLGVLRLDEKERLQRLQLGGQGRGPHTDLPLTKVQKPDWTAVLSIISPFPPGR